MRNGEKRGPCRACFAKDQEPQGYARKIALNITDLTGVVKRFWQPILHLFGRSGKIGSLRPYNPPRSARNRPQLESHRPGLSLIDTDADLPEVLLPHLADHGVRRIEHVADVVLDRQ